MHHLKFIHKLHSILSQPDLQEWIFWLKEDNSVFVVKPYDPQFSTKVLKKYFKHGNVSSFVRQLHMYGFRKTSSNHSNENMSTIDKTDIKWSFTHPSGYFHKDAYSLTLNNIHRKRTGLGKDGKRKNILSPVSVSFIDASPIANSNGCSRNNNNCHTNGFQSTLQNEMVNPNQHQEIDPLTSVPSKQYYPAADKIVNSYGNSISDKTKTMYSPESLPKVGQTDVRPLISTKLTSNPHENSMLNYRSQQTMSRYPPPPNQIGIYSTLTSFDGIPYRQYYNANLFKQDMRQQTQILQPPTLSTGSSKEPFPSFNENVQPHISNVETTYKINTTPNSFNDAYDQESTLVRKRKSISISDISNQDDIGKQSPLSNTLQKSVSSVQINALGAKVNNSRASPIATAMIVNSPPIINTTSASLESLPLIQEKNDKRFRHIETNMESLVDSIAVLHDLVQGLFNNQLAMKNKSTDSEPATGTNTNTDEENGTIKEEKSEKDQLINPENKLKQLNPFMKDMKKVMGSYRDILK